MRDWRANMVTAKGMKYDCARRPDRWRPAPSTASRASRRSATPPMSLPLDSSTKPRVGRSTSPAPPAPCCSTARALPMAAAPLGARWMGASRTGSARTLSLTPDRSDGSAALSSSPSIRFTCSSRVKCMERRCWLRFFAISRPSSELSSQRSAAARESERDLKGMDDTSSAVDGSPLTYLAPRGGAADGRASIGGKVCVLLSGPQPRCC
mmetsp:Transcript_47255/g.151436  ORF Transcript_47255/g.151436 Transcript_47255/m.151436 type:complete len:209 (-) Transcript_47255:36-662(-)